MGLLPTTPTPAKTDIGQISMLVYGPPKIGKSTLASQAPGAIFLATEAGLNHLETYQVPIDSWQTMLNALSELAHGGHGFRTIVIDTVDNAATMCKEHVCRKLGVDDPSDLGYGKGFGAINKEWRRVIDKLLALPYGVVLISHANEVETQDAKGTTNLTVRPTITGKMRQIALGSVDVIVFATADERGRRMLRTKPNPQRYEAGDRTRRLPDPLPMDWEAIADAFANPPPPSFRDQLIDAVQSGRWTRDEILGLIAPAKLAADVPEERQGAILADLASRKRKPRRAQAQGSRAAAPAEDDTEPGDEQPAEGAEAA